MAISKETVEHTLEIYRAKLMEPDLSVVTEECYKEIIKDLEKRKRELDYEEKKANQNEE